MRIQLSAADVPKLSVAALTDIRAVLRAYAGEKVTRLTRLRVERAAQALGLPMPPGDLSVASSARNANAAPGRAAPQEGVDRGDELRD
jgi:hypothetical protein